MIAIIKYNAGNVQSVQYALQRLGVESVVTDDAATIREADKVIFPGVGHASSAMQYLRERAMDQLIVSLQQPVLGICLGLQLMCSHSEEGNTNCLGIFNEQVKLFPQLTATNYKVPQIGWNNIYNYNSTLFNELADNAFVYTVHSYFAARGNETVATTDYIVPYSAALQKDNFYAVQFHPEKSGKVGEKILKNFITIAMTIIPAIDIINGKCVRLTKGDYDQKIVYNDNPLEVAKQFEDAGIKRLHIVDLDGAKAGRIVNMKVLESVAGGTGLAIDFGGGVKTITDVSNVFNAGAAIVTIGSLAVKHPELLEEWLMEFGTDKFLIGADVLDEKIKISGWLVDGGINIFDFIGKMLGIGVTNIFCTDISKDGAMEGPSPELYKKIMAEHPEVNLTASGGVHDIADVILLKEIGCKGAIIGKAIYEGKVPLNPLERDAGAYKYFN